MTDATAEHIVVHDRTTCDGTEVRRGVSAVKGHTSLATGAWTAFTLLLRHFLISLHRCGLTFRRRGNHLILRVLPRELAKVGGLGTELRVCLNAKLTSVVIELHLASGTQRSPII